MNMSARFPLALILSLAAVVGAAQAKPVDESFEHGFDVGPGVILHLKHGDGDVTIDAWDQDRIQVEVRYHYDIKRWAIGGEERRFDMKFDQRGDHVYVAEEISGGGGASLGIHASVRKEYTYTIQAPAYCVLDLEGDDGSVHISDMASDLELRTDDGEIDLFQCSFAGAELSAEDGDISIKSCRGDFEIESDDSDIDVEDCEIAELRIEVEDGNVDLDLVAVPGMDWQVISDDGDIDLDIEGEPSAEFGLETDDGDIRVDVPGLEDMKKRRHSWAGVTGSGEGRVRLRTEDGDIRIRQLSGGS